MEEALQILAVAFKVVFYILSEGKSDEFGVLNLQFGEGVDQLLYGFVGQL